MMTLENILLIVLLHNYDKTIHRRFALDFLHEHTEQPHPPVYYNDYRYR